MQMIYGLHFVEYSSVVCVHNSTLYKPAEIGEGGKQVLLFVLIGIICMI